MISRCRNFADKKRLNRAIFFSKRRIIISPSPILDLTPKSQFRPDRKRDSASKFKISPLAGFFVATILISAAFPSFNVAHASVFSFIADVLSPEQVTGSAGDSRYNSQNISLLQAPLSSKLALAGGDIAIVDNIALEYQPETDPTAYQNDQISTYVVREGDTISQIAKMFNVSVNTVVWANDIKNGVITPGDTLVILPVSGIQHTVKSGDTLESIVKKYSSDIDEIARFNDLAVDAKLTIGNVVIVPHVELSVAVNSGSAKTVKTAVAGYYMHPVDGRFRKTQGIHGHNGVDLAAAMGTRIVASAAGKVIVSKNNGAYNGGYGNYVVISHSNGTQTLYGHLNKAVAVQGSTVAQGQLIGYMGNTGKSTGTHLHFEVRGAKNPF